MKTTVFIVPGLLGSELVLRANKGVVTWISTLYQLLNGPDPFQLAPDGLLPGPNGGVAMVANGPVDAGVYEPLITFLANAGYDPVFVAYDWRLSCRVNAQALADAISSKGLTTPFRVVAHSLGGLVALLAYGLYNPGSSGATWANTVYVCVPFGGSFDAPASVSGVASPFADYALWFNSFGLLTGSGLVPKQQVSALSTRIKRTMASWPSLFELMPGSQAPWSLLHGDTSQFYDASNWGVANSFVTKARLDDAIVTQQAFRTAVLAPQPAKSFVVGNGLYTRDGFKVGGGFEDATAYLLDRVGDHVVCADMATLETAADLTVFADHSDVIGNQAFLANLSALLEGTISLPESIPAPLKPSVVFPPPMTTIEFPPPPFPTLQRRGDP